jgi:hypothetical protein
MERVGAEKLLTDAPNLRIKHHGMSFPKTETHETRGPDESRVDKRGQGDTDKRARPAFLEQPAGCVA